MLRQQTFFVIFMNQKFQFIIFTLANDLFIIWPSSVSLTFHLPEQMLQMNNCSKLFWNLCIKCRSCYPDKLNYLTFKCDLDLQTTWTNVSNSTATPQGKQLCYIIFKSIYKCTSYGPNKLNLWPFYHLTFKCDLDLQHTWTNVSNGTSTCQGEKLCQVTLKSIHKCRSYGPDKSRRVHNACTPNWNCNNYVWFNHKRV